MDWKLEVVMVPVADVERARRFYAEQVGFVVDHDTAMGEGVRIVQLTPPGSGCSIVVSQGMGVAPPGAGQALQLQLVVTDVAAAREELAGRGVEVSPVQHFEGTERRDGHGGPWNSFVFFSDPDGNGWAVQERPAAG